MMEYEMIRDGTTTNGENDYYYDDAGEEDSYAYAYESPDETGKDEDEDEDNNDGS